MTTKVFAIYDAKVGGYLKPFFFRTTGEALRAWMDVVNDPQADFYRHPEDYTMFLLAEYDESKGIFVNETAPVAVASAMELRKLPTSTSLKSVDEKETR